MLETAFSYRESALIVGPPGIGKTTAIHEIARRNKAIILMTATAANGAKSTFFKELGNEISTRDYRFLQPSKISLADRFALIADTLQYYTDKATAIIIDEAQNLAPDTMRLLLDINEKSGVPIAFVGNPHTLKSAKVNQDALRQIWDRVDGHKCEFKGVASGDVHAIAIDQDVEGVDAYSYLEAFAMENKSLRRLASLLREARIFAGERGSIRLAHLRNAVAVLHGEDHDRGFFRLISKAKREVDAA